MTEPGNIWQKLECLQENKEAALKSKKSLNLGEFHGTHGKEDCHAVCKIFGLTGCEWKQDTGECFAYFEKISIGNDYEVSFCYIFDSNLSKGKR